LAVSAYALTSLANCRAFLQKQVADTQQDAEIEKEIDRASQAIITRFGKFKPAETAATKKFLFYGTNRLNLFPYFLGALTSVTFDTEQGGTSTALTNEEYFLRPLDPQDGAYRWLYLPDHTATTPRQVSVLGNWGFSTVPADVEQACIITVATWMRREVAAFSTTFSLEEDRVERPEALPRTAMRLLSPYAYEGQG
jgi:hypothetical protein